MIGTELQRSIDRAASVAANFARARDLNRQVGLIRDAFLVTGSQTALIEGITVDPFWVDHEQWSNDFLTTAMGLGRAVIGRRVMVEFAGKTPFIAYLIGA